MIKVINTEAAHTKPPIKVIACGQFVMISIYLSSGGSNNGIQHKTLFLAIKLH